MTTNIIPQDVKQNSGEGQTQEEQLQKLAKNGYKFVIFAGGYGQGGGTVEYNFPLPDNLKLQVGDVKNKPIEKGKPNPKQFASFYGATDSTQETKIQVPDALWKVVLGFSPGNTSEYPDIHFAWWIPNNSFSIKKTLDYTQPVRDPKTNLLFPEYKNRSWDYDLFRMSIKSLEGRLNKDLPEESQYDFLRNISNSDAKKEEIKEKPKFIGVTAPLLAELDLPQGDLFSSVITTYTAIGHEGFLETAISEFNPENSFVFRPELSFTEISSDQLGTLKANTFEPGSFENRFGQISTDKPHRADSCISQIDSTQVGVVKIALNQPSTSQIGSTQISSLENRLENTDSAHSGIAQISPREIALTQINVGQVSITQNHSSHVNIDPLNAAVTQNNTAQIQPFELSAFPKVSFSVARNVYHDLAKVSFPSGVTADNISNENLLLRHIISPSDVNAIGNSPLNLWNTLFDPFDLTFNINFQSQRRSVQFLFQSLFRMFRQRSKLIGEIFLFLATPTLLKLLSC